jgi:hypothetical protein
MGRDRPQRPQGKAGRALRPRSLAARHRRVR